ncbi:hypothetical protein D3C84_951150 [compost metagenome]
MAACAGVGEDLPATRHRIVAEFVFKGVDQVLLGIAGVRCRGAQLVFARGTQIGDVCFGRHEKIEDVRQPVLDGAEVGTVAPALADVERRLAEATLLRVDLAQVGEVVHPALFRA